MFSCGRAQFQLIENAIESAAIAAEKSANDAALKQFIHNEDELSVRQKASKIAEEAF